MAQDAHTRAEQAVYSVLWNLAGPPGSDDNDGYRQVTVGYDKLATLSHMSKRSLQRLLLSLTEKLAIEAVAEENSALRQGKTYRVYGTAEIMRRRIAAGYLWTARDCSAVRLLKMAASPEVPSVSAASTTAKPPSAGTAENQKEPPSALAKIKMCMADESATDKLLRECRYADRQASEEEILHFVELRMMDLRRRAPVEDWRKTLIALVTRDFANRSEIERYRRAHPRSS